MDNKIDLVICLGSSCFARGNKKIVNLVKGYIEENNLKERVNFKGNHCFGYCERGPVVKINDRIHEEISESTIINILNSAFSGNHQKKK